MAIEFFTLCSSLFTRHLIPPSLHPAFYGIVVGGFDGAVHGAVVGHEMVGAHDVVDAHEESVAVVRDAGAVACGCLTVG